MCLFLAFAAVTAVHGHGTRVGFYSKTCPKAETIVRSTVESHLKFDVTLAAALLRIHFHDCFVHGCDGSILIDGPDTEKTYFINRSLRGFEVIEDARTKLEATCPGVVSCADIVALAARDSVVFSGGSSWKVPTGRRDGLVSKVSETILPQVSDSVDKQKQMFIEKGLSTKDLVTLVGAHTIGTTTCRLFSNRLYNFTGNGTSDPSIDPAILPKLRSVCPQNGDGTKRLAMDYGSQTKFDTHFFANLRRGRGILLSDQVLWADASTKTYVERFLGKRGLPGLNFNKEFAKAMVKMSNIGVKTRAEGEIRKKCSAFNSK
ncbi:hypothetical protein L6164_036307 [Bauhinia variegata]|uniref:Uncharacterized protein n=1 Tax=Bauhinia variegata TaxID=167791 RepID=A0ACB9KGN5_BAUVA|nr:hypothetical protein L6164_036307 [Bauhinia variegata]